MGSKVGSVLTKMGQVSAIAIGAAVAESIHLADEMDKATNSIAANAGISQDAAKKIGAAFLTTGGQTIFTGIQMAQAYATVAGQLGQLNGKALDAAQALSIETNAATLAEAGHVSLTDATSALTAVMVAFHQPIKDATEDINILYQGGVLTGMGVDGLSASIAKFSSGLGAVKPPLAETVGLIDDLVAHGETGRKAVSAITTGLTGLLIPTAAATKAQQEYNVQITDAQGKMLPLTTIIGELQKATDGMGTTQALATLKALGLGTASLKLLDTIRSGPNALQTYTDAVSKHGAADEAAQKATANFHDEMEKLKTEVIDLATSFGEKLMPVLLDVATWLGKHVGLLETLGEVAAGVGTVLAGIWAVDKIKTYVGEITNAAKALGSFITGASGPSTTAAASTAGETMGSAITTAGTTAAEEMGAAIRAAGTTVAGELTTGEAAGGRVAAGEAGAGTAVGEAGAGGAAAGGGAVGGFAAAATAAAVVGAAWVAAHDKPQAISSTQTQGGGILGFVSKIASYIPGIGPDIAAHLNKANTATAVGSTNPQTTALTQIYNAMAKDATTKAQGTTFTGMMQQLAAIKTQDGANSPQYLAALKGAKQTADKWYPQFAQDKTTAQMNTTIGKQFMQAMKDSQTLTGLSKDETLQTTQAKIGTYQMQLLNEEKSGATPTAINATKGLIAQQLTHLAAINTAQSKLATITTEMSNEKALETALSAKLAAVKTAVDAPRLSKMSGGITARVSS